MKLNKILMLFAAVATVSCAKDADTEAAPATGVGMTVIATANEPGRVSVADNEEKVSIAWTTDDSINAVIEGVEGSQKESGRLAEGGSTVEFTFAENLEEGADYRVTHNASLRTDGYSLWIPATQSQSAAGVLDTHSLVLAGVGTAKAGDINTMDFNVRSSVVRFHVSGCAADETVLSVSVKADGITNQNSYDFADEYLGVLGNNGNTATVTLSTPVNAVERSAGIYLLVAAGEYTGAKYVVTTNKGVHTFTSTQTKVYKAGYITTTNLNLANAAFESSSLPASLNIIVDGADWGAKSADGGVITYPNYGVSATNEKIWFQSGDALYGVVDGRIAKIDGDIQDENKISATGSGVYTITVDVLTGEYGVVHHAPAVIGDFSGWTPVTMTQSDDNPCMFVADVLFPADKLNDKSESNFKFQSLSGTWDNGQITPKQNKSWYRNWGKNDSVDTYDNGNQWVFGKSMLGHTYRIELDTKALTVNIYPTDMRYCMSGLNGSWSDAFVDANELAQTATPYVYAWTGDVSDSGLEFKIHADTGIDNGNSDAWGCGLWLTPDGAANPAGISSGSTVSVWRYNYGGQWRLSDGAGNYTITLDMTDFSAPKLTVVKN